jgi:PAS domain S-box-containing protein
VDQAGDRSETQDAGRREWRLLDALLEASPDHIYFKDESGRFLRVSSALARWLGLSDPAEAVGKTEYDFFDPEHARRVREQELSVMYGGGWLKDLEDAEVWPDGRVTWVSSTRAPLRDADGRVFGTFGISRDITTSKLEEEQRHRGEALLDSIIDNVPGALFVKDAQRFRYVRVGGTYTELTGLQPEDVLGKDDYELFPSDADRLRAQDETVVRERRRLDIPDHVLLMAAGLRRLEATKVPICDPGGQPLFVLGYSEDITERREAEEARRESEQRLANLVSNMPGVVYRCALDEAWTMEYMSGQVIAITGYPPSDFVENAARTFASIIHPDDRERVAESGMAAAAATDTWAMDYRIVRADGEIRWVHDRGSIGHSPSGAVTFDGVILDVTDLRRAAEERDQMEADLRMAQKLEAVGQLAAGIAHEINTPIQFVGDSAAFIREGVEDLLRLVEVYQEALQRAADAGAPADLAAGVRKLEEEVDLEYLRERLPAAFERIADGVERVATIVRAMKVFAHQGRAEAGPADLNEALRTTLVVARSELKYCAEVVTDLGDLPPVTCHVDDLNQVFLNLLVNSAHGIEDKLGGADTGEKGRITVSSRLDGLDVVVTISDTGCGIPEDVRPTGVRPVLHYEGRRAWLGPGARDRAIDRRREARGLPRFRERARHRHHVHDPSVDRRPWRGRPAGGCMKRIIFVDDEPKILEGLRDLLRPLRREWSMRFADGPEAALVALEAEPADVVVTDMRMPVMDGAALLGRVRERWPDTVRIILSGHAEVETALRAAPVAHQFLAKPCARDTLVDAVERACNLRAILDGSAIRGVITETTSLPSVPAIYERLVRTLTDPETSVGEVAAVVEQDVAMCAKLLQLVNSSFFGIARLGDQLSHPLLLDRHGARLLRALFLLGCV